MTISKLLLNELEYEASITRRYLEAVPFDKMDWAPNAKSMSLGRLSIHLAELLNWIPVTVNESSLDLSSHKESFIFLTKEELLNFFDKNVSIAQDNLFKITDEQLSELWTLKSGEIEIFTMPKYNVFRSMIFNHLVHHRAQLGVYFRLLGVSVPKVYGPSADEQ